MATFGEITIELGGVSLPLKFKTRNLREIEKITGKHTLGFFEPFLAFDPDAQSDLAAMGKLCDYDVFITLVRAGLATDQRYRRQTSAQFEDKICDLLDAEAEARDCGTYPILMELTPLIVTEALKSMARVKDVEPAGDAGDPKNEETPKGD